MSGTLLLRFLSAHALTLQCRTSSGKFTGEATLKILMGHFRSHLNLFNRTLTISPTSPITSKPRSLIICLPSPKSCLSLTKVFAIIPRMVNAFDATLNLGRDGGTYVIASLASTPKWRHVAVFCSSRRTLSLPSQNLRRLEEHHVH